MAALLTSEEGVPRGPWDVSLLQCGVPQAEEVHLR